MQSFNGVLMDDCLLIALMYCSLDSLIGKVRGEEDQLNSIAAATGAGMIFKSTGKMVMVFYAVQVVNQWCLRTVIFLTHLVCLNVTKKEENETNNQTNKLSS